MQCEKKLWFDYYRKDLKIPPDARTQAVFDLGHVIGSLAQSVFPGGKDATPESYNNLQPSIEKTSQWLAEGEDTIYEATFSSGNAFCMLDILHHHNGERWAVEVKNSTTVKDYHLKDAALQYWVMAKAGYRPDKFFLMHINNQYVKNGAVTNELFTLTDITENVVLMQDWVTENLDYLVKVLDAGTEPDISIGQHCGSPFACEYMHHCWKETPEDSVFTLTRGGGKSWSLYEQGIVKLSDIPEDFPLSFNQRLQVGNKEYFDAESIAGFLNSWQYPLHFFDFETIMPAIPVLDGTRPYQQIPFQYSLHIMEKDGQVKHYEYLAEPSAFSGNTTDPRKTMIETMKQHFGSEGSIVTYNQSFEISRLNELARDFPEDADFLQCLVRRTVDLYTVFSNRWYYKPEMGASASIKSVLPALCPELSYSDLEIQNGGNASELFLQSVHRPDLFDENLRTNLLKYCELDTYGMVAIYEHLRNRILGI